MRDRHLEPRRTSSSVENKAVPEGSPPSTPPAPMSSAPLSVSRRLAVVKRKILLVDDSLASLMMRNALTKGSYEVIAARDGREAVERALSERPDFVIIDAAAPTTSGFQTCKWLRALEVTKTRPILLVLARGEPARIENGRASGCTDYILRPFEDSELIAKIKAHVGE
jgi:DNA-binding response OmpR family regulator